MGVLDVGQVFVVGDNGDRVRCSLDILMPFHEGEDDHEEFSIIDVIVALSRKKGMRKVGTGVEVTIGISLEQNGTCCE